MSSSGVVCLRFEDCSWEGRRDQSTDWDSRLVGIEYWAVAGYWAEVLVTLLVVKANC